MMATFYVPSSMQEPLCDVAVTAICLICIREQQLPS
jgi:hypothetical protein